MVWMIFLTTLITHQPMESPKTEFKTEQACVKEARAMMQDEHKFYANCHLVERKSY